MKRILFLILMVLLFQVFPYGCASTSDYNSLRSEFDQLKQETRVQTSQLHDEMTMFRQAYDPGLHEIIVKNITEAERQRDAISKLKIEIDNTSGKINRLLQEAEDDRIVIAENMRSSKAQNIVNEFRQLSDGWQITLSELTNLTRDSEKAVDDSYIAAMRASEMAGAAERSADFAVKSFNRIDEQMKSIGAIHERLKDIEFRVQRISRQLIENRGPGENIPGDKKLEEKIAELEKEINALKAKGDKEAKKPDPPDRRINR